MTSPTKDERHDVYLSALFARRGGGRWFAFALCAWGPQSTIAFWFFFFFFFHFDDTRPACLSLSCLFVYLPFARVWAVAY